MGPVARTEPAAIFPFDIRGFLPLRYATEVGADSDEDEPFGMAFVNAFGVRLRIAQGSDIYRIGLRDFRLCAVTDEHRLPLPHHGDCLPRFDRRKINLGGGQRNGVGGGVHLVDKRPGDRTCAHRAKGGGSQKKEIAAGFAMLRFDNIGIAGRMRRGLDHYSTVFVLILVTNFNASKYHQIQCTGKWGFVEFRKKLSYKNGMTIRLAFYKPEIPQNVGAGLRLAACLGLPVDIIEPTGFPWDDTKIRRSGMDYIDYVTIQKHPNWDSFVNRYQDRRIVLMTTKAPQSYLDFTFQTGDILLAGQESAGVPPEIHAACGHRVTIPMATGPRSLNIINACAMIAGEALRQLR